MAEKKTGRPRKAVKKEEEGRRISAILGAESHQSLRLVQAAEGGTVTEIVERAINEYARGRA